MQSTIKPFDAVVESRKWKEVVARETAGMTRDELLAYFDRSAVSHRFQEALALTGGQELSPEKLKVARKARAT